MPDSSKEVKKPAEIPNKNESGKKRRGTLAAVIMLFLVLLVIAAVSAGVFSIIIHNNINGFGERYRKTIQSIPLIRLALPKAPDPSDPRYMTDAEIKKKYLEFKSLSEELQKKLDESAVKLEELGKYKDEAEKAAQSLKDSQASFDARQKQLDDLKKTVDGLIVNGDKAGFKQYYESVDPAIAKEVYAEIVKQQQADENMKQFALLYEAMDPSAAAQIFEQMGSAKIDLTAQTLKCMKKQTAASILAAMTPDFASEVTEKLNSLYTGN